MKDSSQIQAAIEILAEIESRRDVPADQLCSSYYRARRYIGSKDRRSIAARVYGVLRRRAHCDWWCLRRGLSPLQLSPTQASRVRMLAYLWIYDEVPRANLGILFSGEKYAPSKLDDREKKLFSVKVDEIPAPLWVQGEYPEWLHSRILKLYGPNLQCEMEAYISEAPVDLRVNSLKTTREELQVNLQDEGILTNALHSTPWGLRCRKRIPLSQSPLLQKGCFEIQDEGSQLLAEHVRARPGEAILDFCAGAGGKTLAMAAQMQNKGRLVATDIAEWRLKRAKDRLKRAGVHNAECRTLDSLNDKWLKRQSGKFDKVLVDAPCSGTGTWRRNPDQKWRLKPSDLEELTRLQLEILRTAAKLVTKGGYLVYGTCSFLKEENDDVVDQFLSEHPQYECVEEPLRLSPCQTETDGFFCQKMQKKA